MVDSWLHTPEQRIESAKENKELGSENFKNRDYKSAGECYINALRDIIPIIQQPEEYDSTIKTLKVACYSNLAACQLKLGQYDRVIKNCNKCLDLDEDNLKCLFRRATAYLEYKYYEKAEQDIQAMLLQEPDNSAAKQLESRLKTFLYEKDKYDAKIMKAYLHDK